jgi:hypothetical protein
VGAQVGKEVQLVGGLGQGATVAAGRKGGAGESRERSGNVGEPLKRIAQRAKLPGSGAVQISGTALRADATAVSGAAVQLQSTPHGRQAWTTVATLPVSDAGFVTASFRPVGSSDYRLHITPSATEAGSDSNKLTVIVQPVVIAAVSKTVVRHGRTVGLHVSIPGHAGQVVTVERWAHNAWHRYATVRLGANGKRSVAVRPLLKGRYRFRFIKPADSFHLVAFSKALTVKAL